MIHRLFCLFLLVSLSAEIKAQPLKGLEEQCCCKDANETELYFIHGTGSAPEAWNHNPELRKEFREKFNCVSNSTLITDKLLDDHELITWDGGNNSLSRKLAIESAYDHIIENHDRGNSIVIVGHSHGGNIAVEVAEKLTCNNYGRHVILVTLNTPVRITDYEYDCDKPPFGNHNFCHYNIYINNDGVQVNGGSQDTRRIWNIKAGRKKSKPGKAPKGFLVRKLLLFAFKLIWYKEGFQMLGGESGPADREFPDAHNLNSGNVKSMKVKRKHRLWHEKNHSFLKTQLDRIQNCD